MPVEGRSQKLPDRWSIARRQAKAFGNRLAFIFGQADRIRDTFPLLPGLAALAILILLAADGQMREIYLSALEEIHAEGLVNWHVDAPLGFAVLGLGLLSALLFQAQFWLTHRAPKPILPNRANPDAGSIGERLQRTTAIALALSPWFGVVIGLVRAQFYLDGMARIFQPMVSNPPNMWNNLPAPAIGWVAAAALILGTANAIFLQLHRKNSLGEATKHFDQGLRNFIVVTTPLAAMWMLLLLIDYQPVAGGALFITLGSIATLGAMAGYYFVYGYLNSAPVMRLTRHGAPLLQRHRRLFMFAWLLLPWTLVAPCFAAASSFSHGSLLGGTISPGQWTAIPIAMAAAIVAALIVVQRLDYLQQAKARALRRSTIALIVLLALAAWIFSLAAGVDTVVWLYRLIGPLATTTIALIFLLSLLLLLAWLSQISGYPALSLAVIATVAIVLSPVSIFVPAALLIGICIVTAGAALLAERWAIAGIAGIIAAVALVSGLEARTAASSGSQNTQTSASNVCEQFESWLQGKTWIDRGQAKPASASTSSAAGNSSTAQSPCVPTIQSAEAPTGEANGGSSQPNGTTSQANSPVAQGPKKKAFIIAVEGGGIYAAAAASLFLQRMEQAAPDFMDHVFAISGVSGGAIGASVFTALDAAENQSGSTGAPQPTGSPAGTKNGNAESPSGAAAAADCPTQAPATAPLDAVCAIMEDDHYSALVGSIFPELLGASTGRAQALAASIARSVRMRVLSPFAEQELDGGFADYRAKVPQVPALVLNATSVETGLRIAFAPFPLHDIDQSLYSFADSKMPQIQGAAPGADAKCIQPRDFCASLINAAVVSARFPLILPPLSLSVSGSNDTSRWNLVDGGYADNSGAATALALYQALKSIAQSYNVDLQLILVTSIDPPDLSSIHGTAFRDTLAPIYALLDVRQAESMAAVARACNAVYGDQSRCEDHAGQVNDDLLIVKIDDKTYGLPLGWELSNTTFGIISWMLGSVETATQEKDKGPCNQYVKETNQALRSEERNSCVLTTIAASLQGQ